MMNPSVADPKPEQRFRHLWEWRAASPSPRARDLLIIAGVALLSLAAIWVVVRILAGVLYGDWERHLCNMDCHWFMSILEAGYDNAPRSHQAGYANYAFFPGFPVLASIPQKLFGLEPRDALVLTSILSYFAAAFTLYAYIARRLDRSSALFGALLLLVSPYAVYGYSGYSEPLYFLLTTLGFWAAFERRWLAAGICGALLSATRSNGVLFAVVLAVAGLRSHPSLMADRKELISFMLALALTCSGLLAFMAYLQHLTGDALAFAHVQVAWDRHFVNPLQNLARGFSRLDRFLYFGSVAAAGLGMSIYLALRRFYEESVVLCLNILIPLSTGLHSIPRFVGWQMSLFIGVVLLVRSCSLRQGTVLAISAVLGLLMASAWAALMDFTV